MGFILYMKVNFYTYNQNPTQYKYTTPIFKAKAIKVNWNSESGKLIEKTLLAFAASAAAAGLSQSENFKSNKKYLEDAYKHSKDTNILEKHALLYKDAYKNKDIIIEYAKQVCAEIGKNDMNIYAGPGLHKVDMSGYELINKANMKILGKTYSGTGVYLDFDGKEHKLNGKSVKTDLYKIE